MVVLTHFLDRLADLDSAVQLECARCNRHQHLVGSGEGVDRDPGEDGRAVDDDLVVGVSDRIQTLLQACLTVVSSRGQLDVRFRQQDVGRDKIQARDRCPMDGERLALENGDVDRLIALEGGVVRGEDTGGVGLPVQVNEKDTLALASKSCGQSDRGGGLSNTAFL